MPFTRSMYSTEDTAGSLQWVSPFGNLRVNRLFTANRSLSQCPTSFIGTWRQGIHHKPLVASPRDAEKSILLMFLMFGLHTIQLVRYGWLTPVHRLTGDGRSSLLPGSHLSASGTPSPSQHLFFCFLAPKPLCPPTISRFKKPRWR